MIDQATLDLIPDPILVAEADGLIIQRNQAARAFFPSAQRAETSLRELLPFVRLPVEAVAGTRLRGRISVRPTPAEPRLADVDVSVGVSAEGTVERAVYVVHDVTQYADTARGGEDLLYSVAHELRSPFGVVDNALGMLSTEFTNLTTQAFTRLLDTARRSNQRLRLLIDDLLNAGNIRAGRFVVDPQPTELATILNEAVDSVAPSISERHQRIELDVTVEDWRVLADERYAQRVVANLLANASKYGPDGGVIEVHADPVDGNVLIAVQDHGPGIPAEEQIGVFERFYRARTGDEPGFGLGLAIARNIVEAHGGQIGLYSEPGQGTRVWFTLPKASETA